MDGGAFSEFVEVVGKGVDAAGVAVIVLGFAWATLLYLGRVARNGSPNLDLYTSYRQAIGRAILLGLEILVAADIIRTVAVTPTFESVSVLAIIVLIRTFLSATLELELTGRWPWQQRSASSPRTNAA
ncbi:MAG: hypothetical protein JWL76_472 [Thermoleophilia bacterium]|nr:hypothetical protein [Thermoleophilia bacterium]